MSGTKIFIKNMVCQRCIMAVDKLLTDLKIAHRDLQLGEATLHEPLTQPQHAALHKALEASGFELIDKKNDRIISQIKSALVEWVHIEKIDGNTRLSDYLCSKLHADYSHLSKLFSDHVGTTIEKYFIAQKIEKTKELLLYNELSLSQIADQLSYSSVAYLSAQFKKNTGLTPTQFRNSKTIARKPLDQI